MVSAVIRVSVETQALHTFIILILSHIAWTTSIQQEGISAHYILVTGSNVVITWSSLLLRR